MKNEGRLYRDRQRKRAARFFVENYTREQRYLISLSQDLSKSFSAINAVGIEESKKFQFFYDFLVLFEELKDLMSYHKFHWSKEFLKENGIDFESYRDLYFAVA